MKKRELIATVLVLSFMLILVIRLGYIAMSKNFTVSSSYNSYSVMIDKRCCNLYYSNFSKLTNNEERYMLVVKPTEKCVGELHSRVNADAEKYIISKLKQGKPVLYEIKSSDKDKFKYNKVIRYYDTVYNSKQLFDKSCSGLLSYMSDEKLVINYNVDANGRMLSGDNGKEKDSNYYNSLGYVLTLDKDIQKIAYNAATNIESGCIVIMDTESSSILACVTKPDNSYINKPLSLYSAGSIFKIVVALCAIENGVDLSYCCRGRIKVGDTEFSCQNKRAHNNETLKTALAASCNCYFVNLALYLGSEKIVKTAIELGFNDKTELFNGMSFTNGELPSENQLESKGELSLLGFGQGKLRISPLHFCNALCTIANGGVKNDTKVIKAEIDANNNVINIDYKKGKRIIQRKDSEKLLKYLRYVVSDGTAHLADYNNQSAGKTATAQTGQFENGKEKYNTYFAGIYPCSSPKYAVLIMCEDGISGSINCCPVFRTIVESIDKL